MKSKTDYSSILSELGRVVKPNEIRKLTKLLGRSDVISLAAGAPSPETFPTEQLAEIASRVILAKDKSSLQYGATRGLTALLDQVISILQQRGLDGVTAEQIVVTTGSQQGLDLVSRVLIDPGDIAMVELPSYIGGIIALHNSRASMIGIKQDEGGIDIEDLRAKLRRARSDAKRVKCIYTIPNFQNPSGVTMLANRREQLAEIADEYDLLIIEDDPYFDLHFGSDGSRLRPIAALHPSRVIYLSSFSKVLAPGLRCAYVFAPAEISAKIELVKEGADLSSSLLDQAIVAEAIRGGLIESRLPEIRRFYQVRCKAMLEALDRFAPAGSRWTTPDGGFFILMEAPPQVDSTEALPDAIENGVVYVPGKPFFVDGTGGNTLRLAFSKETPENIISGVERMCEVLSARATPVRA